MALPKFIDIPPPQGLPPACARLTAGSTANHPHVRSQGSITVQSDAWRLTPNRSTNSTLSEGSNSTVSQLTSPWSAQVAWYTCLSFSNILLISHWTFLCSIFAQHLSTFLGSLTPYTSYRCIIANLKHQPVRLYTRILLFINAGLPIILLGTSLSDIIPWTRILQVVVWMVRASLAHPIPGVYMHLLAFACAQAIQTLPPPTAFKRKRKTLGLPLMKQFRPIAHAYIRLKWLFFCVHSSPPCFGRGSANWGLKSKLAKQTRSRTIKMAFGEGTCTICRV